MKNDTCMPTIQFTYDKKENCYCYGFWIKDRFVVRGKSKDKASVWSQFCKELRVLEGK